MGRSAIFGERKWVNTLSRDVSRCAGWPIARGEPAVTECQTCSRFVAGLDVRPIAQTEEDAERPVAWMQPPRETPCPRRLPATPSRTRA